MTVQISDRRIIPGSNTVTGIVIYGAVRDCACASGRDTSTLVKLRSRVSHSTTSPQRDSNSRISVCDAALDIISVPIGEKTNRAAESAHAIDDRAIIAHLDTIRSIVYAQATLNKSTQAQVTTVGRIVRHPHILQPSVRCRRAVDSVFPLAHRSMTNRDVRLRIRNLDAIVGRPACCPKDEAIEI